MVAIIHPEGNCPELDSGPHEMHEIEKTELLDLDGYSAYKLTHQCQHCSNELHGWRVDNQPETVPEFTSVLYQLYESFYENPRPISHNVLIQLAPGDYPGTNQPLAGILGKAIDLGNKHGRNNRDKLSKQELLDWTVPERE